MKEAKITVIIPVYNTKKYLEECVESVINQTYRNLQIILVDDGSQDGSSVLCDKLLKKDSRIEIIHKQNEGLGLTRNRGLKSATGEYVTFLDSDDWYSLTHIENLVSETKNHSLDIIFGCYTKASNQKKILNTTELPIHGLVDEVVIKNKVMFQIIAADNDSKRDLGIPMSVCFNLYKTDIIRNNEIYFPSEKIAASEDIFFNLQYLNHCQSAYFTNEVGYYYRYNPDSITRRYDEKQIERTEQFYYNIMKCVNELNIDDSIYNRIDRCIVAKVRGLLLMISRSSIDTRSKIIKMKHLLNETWVVNVLKNYETLHYRLSLRITTHFMKTKNVICLFIILFVKNKLVRR